MKKNLTVSSAFLKNFALITMFIDHLTCCFLEVARGRDGASLMYHIPGGVALDIIGRGIGRSAFPIFCFLITEGYFHTRSKAKYLIRLVLFGLISWIPFRLLFFPYSASWIHTDTMFTLALGLSAIWIIDAIYTKWGREALSRRIAGAALCILTVVLCARVADLIHSDYGGAGVVTVIIFFALRRYRPLACIGAWTWLSLYNNSEILSAPGVFLISRYNGERGRQNKYFFYVFYPGHLLILYLIRRALFGA